MREGNLECIAVLCGWYSFGCINTEGLMKNVLAVLGAPPMSVFIKTSVL